MESARPPESGPVVAAPSAKAGAERDAEAAAEAACDMGLLTGVRKAPELDRPMWSDQL
jgi:hypothetical protein